jgi:branched-chain amino acid transport system substrate-binding protein
MGQEMKGHRFTLTATAAVALLATALTACGQNRLQSSTPGQPVTVGLITPLSPPGDVASGQLIQRGAELGIAYVNSQMHGVLGGRRLQLAVEDSAGTNDRGVNDYRQLVTEKQAVAVTGFFHSSVNIAVNEVAHQIGVPTISTQGSAADITAKHYPETFRTHVIDPIRVSAWLQWIEEKGFKRVAMIAETTDYGVGLVNETQRQAKARGLDIAFDAEMFDHSATDLTPQLLKAKAFGPDLLINIGVGTPMDLIVDQAREVGLSPQVPMLVSYDGPVRPQWWQLHPQDGSGVYFIAYYSPREPLSSAGKWMAQRYQRQYHEAPVYSSLSAFGDILLIAEAIDKARSTDPRKITAALSSGPFPSWTSTPASFPDAQGPYYHTWSPPVLILHYTQPGQDWQRAEVVETFTQKTAG